MTTGPVMVVGDAAIDIRFWNEHQTTAENARVQRTSGGAAANTAVALARLDCAARFVGAVGDDPHGRFLAEQLKLEHVDTALLRCSRTSSTLQVIYAMDSNGEIWGNAVWPELRDSAVFDVPAEHVSSDDVVACTWLHVVGLCLLAEPLRTTTLTLMEAARGHGVPISVDLNLRGLEQSDRPAFEEVLLKALGLADVVFGSETEFCALYSGLTAEAGAARIANMGATVVLRRGVHGSSALAGNDRVEAPAFEVEAVSAVGAGDAFNGGFIVSMLRGEPLAAALTYGNATAGATVSHPAGQAPSASTVAQLVREAQIALPTR